MKKKSYMIAKSNYEGELIFVNYEKLDGFKVTPKNKISYPGIKVNSLIIVKPSFIEKILKKKVKRKLEYYLQYIISIIDDESQDDTGLRSALNDLSRYREVVEYKYRKFLDDKYINLLLKKISLLEREIKSKLIYKKIKIEKTYEEPVMEETKQRSR